MKTIEQVIEYLEEQLNTAQERRINSVKSDSQWQSYLIDSGRADALNRAIEFINEKD